ncbi:hypothetical protein CC78DRAFT_619396 [Lojkania enalia]|uniref:Uncharacterized protein n=1 Tax=Lojkania enalia TaxID=147567 RepID=A0A9P4N1D0_9PLEO|nr:hypothetical protein CC78DRAFT_619396 [Didymosphaeria enalia]
MRRPEFKMPALPKMPSMKPRMTNLFKREPVFNRPVCTERRYRVARILYVVFLSSLVALSIAVVVLKAMTIAFIEENKGIGFMFETSSSGSTLLAALPRMLYVAPAKISIVAAVISIFIGTAHLAFVVRDWKDGKKTQAYSFCRNSMFVHLTNSMLVLFSLVSIYVTHKMTSHFSARYVNFKADHTDEGVWYRIGTFDLETWSCELKTEPGAKIVWEDYGMQCEIEIAARWVMIPFMICAFAVALTTIWGMVTYRRDPDGERIKTEDLGLEMGKFNAI